MGLQKPDSGEVILGEHNVLPNYFEQNQVIQSFLRNLLMIIEDDKMGKSWVMGNGFWLKLVIF